MLRLVLVGLNHVDLGAKPGEQLWVEPQAVLGLALLTLQQPRKQLHRKEGNVSLVNNC